MTNRLDDGWTGKAPDLGPMQIGERRTFTATQGTKTITITRTDRPYAFDLCDAYNDALMPEARANGLCYEVNGSGEVQLCFPRSFSEALTKELERKRERERQDWKHRHRYPASAVRDEAA